MTRKYYDPLNRIYRRHVAHEVIGTLLLVALIAGLAFMPDCGGCY